MKQPWHLYIGRQMIIQFWRTPKSAVPAGAEEGAISIALYNQYREEGRGLIEFTSPWKADADYFVLGFPDFSQKKMEIGVGLGPTGTEESMICEQIPSPF